MPPHVFIRAASSQTIEVQDMLPADTRFKILVFAGNISDDSDRSKLQALGGALNKPESFLRRHGRGDVGKWEVFDVLCFSSAKTDHVGYLGACLSSPRRPYTVRHPFVPPDFPEFFRTHYSK